MVWIYEFEAHPVFGPVVHPFFHDRLDAGKNQAGSSLLKLGELLVQPFASGRVDIADSYRKTVQIGPIILLHGKSPLCPPPGVSAPAHGASKRRAQPCRDCAR